MNILPKKRWHVRTKDNIARVRRDEAQAKEDERICQEKLLLAESEARINFLRKRSNLPLRRNSQEEIQDPTKESTASLNESQTNNQEHVNLFADYKSHIKKTNKALEDEKKEEREKYEKQIGYLTYLGQDTNEALKLRSWYEVPPKRTEVEDDISVEKDLKKKESQDPLTLMKYLNPPSDLSTIKPNALKVSSNFILANMEAKKRKREHEGQQYKKHKKSKKHKKHKHKKTKKKKAYSSEESDSEESRRIKDKIEKLRRERLIREASERARQEALLAPIITKNDITTVPKQDTDTKTIQTPRIVQKYNSQFNPDIAKQNMI